MQRRQYFPSINFPSICHFRTGDGKGERLFAQAGNTNIAPKSRQQGILGSGWLRSLRFILLSVVLIWGLGGFAMPEAQALVKPESLIQPYLDRVTKNVTEFQLDNGLKFIVLERHQAPVVSFMTYVNVGAADEPTGQTGVAHYLEHLAFKGTQRIGTQNYTAEKPVLDRLDQLFTQIKAAKAQHQDATLKTLEKTFAEVQKQADTYVHPNQFGEIVEQAGGVGLNASTSNDETQFFYSFPSNKLELWMSLESERFLEPVFRDFFSEKSVILEERRTRTENSPTGQMLEALLGQAYQKHPYGRPTIGSTEDIQNLERSQVQAFFNTYYVPSNITIAIVGDVKPDQVKEFATAYFGRYPKRPKPSVNISVEPPQDNPREVTLNLASQPWYFEAYHIPAIASPDYVIYEVISRILSEGRTSRLYKSLVERQQVALSAEGSSGYPGDKYPNLMLLYAQSTPGQTEKAVQTALDAEIERLKTEIVSDVELARVKKQIQVDTLESLNSNSGMASLLAEYEVKTGDWRNLFAELDQAEAITPQDIQRVARQTFVESNRTVGRILPKV